MLYVLGDFMLYVVHLNRTFPQEFLGEKPTSLANVTASTRAVASLSPSDTDANATKVPLCQMNPDFYGYIWFIP